jgi:hypothetical protein
LRILDRGLFERENRRMADQNRPAVPTVRQVVLDTMDARGLAEFYRVLLGWSYRPGDEPAPDEPAPDEPAPDEPAPDEPAPDEPAADWLVLRNPAGGVGIALQQVESLTPSTWPDQGVPQQLHLDTTVASIADLDEQHERVLALGGRLLFDRSDDPEEPLRVYADPSGHPFCIFVA